MKTRRIATYIGIAALAAAAELSTTEQRTQSTGSSPEDEAGSPIGILIMAAGRSGSSMVGEFFRQSEVRHTYCIGAPTRNYGNSATVSLALCEVQEGRPEREGRGRFR